MRGEFPLRGVDDGDEEKRNVSCSSVGKWLVLV